MLSNDAFTLEDEIGFGFGQNMNRRLGIDERGDQIKPVKCDFGPFITVDASEETCSISRDGQLKVNGEIETRLNKPVKLATTGEYGSRFAVDNGDKLWTWGGNGGGRLGHGDLTDRAAPTMVEELKDKRIKQLSVY